MFYTECMSVAVRSLRRGAPSPDSAYGFRLVLPQDKRDRLALRAAALAVAPCCSVGGCGAECVAVLLVESEQEARLCPRHQLVGLDGRAIQGQPMLAMAGW
jgi:hypothetical protein